QVHVKRARSDQRVAADISERVIGWNAVTRSIEPAGDAIRPRSARVMRRAEQLRLIVADRWQAERSIVSRRDIQRETTLQGPDPGCLPSAQDGSQQPRLRRGQLPQVVQNKPVRYVEIRCATVGIEIEGIDDVDGVEIRRV